MTERSSALDSSSGVVRMWIRIPAWPAATLVSLSKTLNHNCFILRMGRKAVGLVCCVMHVKEPRTLIVIGACTVGCVNKYKLNILPHSSVFTDEIKKLIHNRLNLDRI